MSKRHSGHFLNKESGHNSGTEFAYLLVIDIYKFFKAYANIINQNYLKVSCFMKTSVLVKETELPEEIRGDFQKRTKEDTSLISIEGYGGLLNVLLDRYVEHQITTDKVISGILKDLSGAELSGINI
jgi:hypothetical protein